MEPYPTTIERNDPAQAIRWIEAYFANFGGPPPEDAMAMLYQLQDDPTELEALAAEIFARHEAKPEEIAVE